MSDAAVPDLYVHRLVSPRSFAVAPVAYARPIQIGAIRYDAWDAPATSLTQAEAAALSPAEYRARAPFWATVSGGVTLPAATQQRMDSEIAQAKAAKLSYWAFLGWQPGAPEGAALSLYRSSTSRAGLGFCMIETFQSLYYLGTFLDNVTRTIGLMADPAYVRVLDGRPVLFVLSMSDALIAERFGSMVTTQAVFDGIRSRAIAAGVGNPYIVALDGWADRALRFVALGADAAGAYASPGTFSGARPYADLVAAAGAWRAAASVARIVPPMMAGWDFRPRIATPSEWFGGQVNGNPANYYEMPAAAELTAHVAETRAWIAANPTACPAQTGLLYAWNEFTEGGFVCPTFLAGQPAGDTTRIAALAAALGE